MSLKDKIISTAKSLSEKLDKNPINIGGSNYYTTKFGSLIGLVFLIIMLIYIIQKFISSYYVYTNIIVNQQQINMDPSRIYLDDWNMRARFYAGDTSITPENMFQYGVNITAAISLGPTYNSKFNQSYLILCPGTDTSLLCYNPALIRPYTQGNAIYQSCKEQYYFSIHIKQCLTGLDIRCKSTPSPIQFTIYLNIPMLNPLDIYFDTEYETKSYVYQQYGKVYLASPQRYNLFITSTNCTSDLSIMPSFIPRQITTRTAGILTDTSTEKIVNNPVLEQKLGEVFFRRTLRSQVFTRKRHTLDQLFAGALGVSAVLGLIIKILFSHYNKWCSEQQILKEITEKNRQHKGSFDDYIKYLLGKIKRNQREKQIIETINSSYAKIYKQNEQKDIQIQVLKERLAYIEKQLKFRDHQNQCRRRVKERRMEQIKRQNMQQQHLKQSLLLNQQEQK